jgi:hypothetical protein
MDGQTIIYSYILGKHLNGMELIRLWKIFRMVDWADPKEWRD